MIAYMTANVNIRAHYMLIILDYSKYYVKSFTHINKAILSRYCRCNRNGNRPTSV